MPTAFGTIESAPGTVVQAQELDEVIHRTGCTIRQQLEEMELYICIRQREKNVAVYIIAETENTVCTFPFISIFLFVMKTYHGSSRGIKFIDD
jgi:hypothetical protein